MAADAIFAGGARDGRLNPVVTLGLAAAGTALVLAGLLFAFSRRIAPPPTSARMLLRLIQVPVALPSAASPQPSEKPAEIANSAHTVALPRPVKSKVLPHLPAPVPSRLDLSMGLPSPTQPLPAASGPHAFNPYSDLERALKAPPKPATMENDSSFRSIYGYPVSKVGGVCSYSVPIEHLSLSPSVHPHVAFVIPCPGSYQPSMDDELDIWADKEKKKQNGNGSG